MRTHAAPKITFIPWGLDPKGGGVWRQGLGIEQLFVIRDWLNSSGKPTLTGELRQLFEDWKKSGPDLRVMMETNPWLHRVILTSFQFTWSPLKDGSAELFCELLLRTGNHSERSIPRLSEYDNLEDDFKSLKSTAMTSDELPTRNEEFELCGQKATYDQVDAIELFFLFTLNREWQKLGGPCFRCDEYYIKKRANQKVYCSRRCGNITTALVRTKARLDAEHEAKLARAKALIERWNSLKRRPQLDWRRWFELHETAITMKFVTRWLNKGKLPKPKAWSQR